MPDDLTAMQRASLLAVWDYIASLPDSALEPPLVVVRIRLSADHAESVAAAASALVAAFPRIRVAPPRLARRQWVADAELTLAGGSHE